MVRALSNDRIDSIAYQVNFSSLSIWQDVILETIFILYVWEFVNSNGSLESGVSATTQAYVADPHIEFVISINAGTFSEMSNVILSVTLTR
jgi:hypothetical protein